MLKKIALGLLVVVMIFVVIVATRSSTLRVERSQTIAAPAAVVYAMLHDFHTWQEWSPWEKLDPNMERIHSGTAAGTGAIYEWKGNDDVGKGRMTIVESHPPEHLSIRLEFLEPWEATNETTFTIKPEGENVLVTWTMQGQKNFMVKALCLFMDMDAMIGKDFEQGLANLKVAAEAKARVSAES